MQQVIRQKASHLQLEDEEDILRLQQEFLSTNQRPAATLVRSPLSATPRDLPKDKTLFAAHQELEEREAAAIVAGGAVVSEDTPVHTPVVKRVLDFDSHFDGVMGLVTEKDVVRLDLGRSPVEWNNKPPSTGFPEPVHRSVFQRIHAQKQSLEKATSFAASVSTAAEPFSSAAKVAGVHLYNQFHEENLKRLAEMSESDILDARAQLLQSLDPKLLEKFMHKKPVTSRDADDIPKPGLNARRPLLNHGEEKHVHFQNDTVIIGEGLGGDVGDGVVVDTDLVVDGIKENEPLHHYMQEEMMNINGLEDEADDSPLVMKIKYFLDVPAEPEKLEWMGVKLPSSNPISNTSSQPTLSPAADTSPAAHPRFDFTGAVLDPTTTIPVYKGLHHHGDDPDLPGYTLPELFHLMRSQIPSQRVIALNTVARVLGKIRRGDYPDPQAAQIVKHLSSDKYHAVAYLRSALDDRNVAVVVAAVEALAAWLAEEEEGEEATRGSGWGWREKSEALYRGYEGMSMAPLSGIGQIGGREGVVRKFGIDIFERRDLAKDGEAAEETEGAGDTIEAHVRLAEKDLVAALVRMQIFPKLQYLLEHLANDEETGLGQRAIELLMCILLRIVRNSSKACAELVDKTPRLVDLVWRWGVVRTQWPIVEEPEKEIFVADHKATGAKKPRKTKTWPSTLAICFLRTLAQSSRDTARDVCIGKGYADDLLRFIMISPLSMAAGPPRACAYHLQIEALRTYRVFAAYGLFCHVLADIFVVVPGWIVGVGQDIEDAGWIARRTVAVLGLLEAYTHAAADTHKMEPEHDICWAQPTSYLRNVLVTIVESWSEKLKGTEGYLGVAVLSSALGYVAAWCRYLNTNFPPGGNAEVRGVWETVSRVVRNEIVENIVLAIEGGENAQNVQVDPRRWEMGNLAGIYHPEAKRLVEKRADEAIITDLLLRVVQTAESFGRVSVKTVEEEARAVLTSSGLMRAVEVLRHRGSDRTSHWTSLFGRPRNFTLWTWVYAVKTLGLVDLSVPRQIWIGTATDLIASLNPNDEWYAKWLLDNAVLAENVMDDRFLRLFPGQRPALPLGALRDILDPFYRALLGSDGQIAQSKNLCIHEGRNLARLMMDYSKMNHTGLPLSYLWVFVPIDELYNSNVSKVLRELPDGYHAKEVEIVIAALEVAKIFGGTGTEHVSMPLDSAGIAVALMKIFMINEKTEDDDGWSGTGEVFLDPRVDRLVSWWLDQYSATTISQSSVPTSAVSLPLEEAWLTSMRNHRTIATPFYQFYQDFAAQYAAVSFGNLNFRRLLIPALSASYPSDYKSLIWNDLFDILHTIQLDLEDMPCMEYAKGLETYLYPIEASTAVLRFYLRAVLEGKVRKEGRCGEGRGALYWIAVHHLSGVCFTPQADAEVNRPLVREIVLMMYSKGGREVVGDWIGYQGKDENGMLVPPPRCYEFVRGKDLDAKRVEIVRELVSVGGGNYEEIVERLKSI
ncbi:hypothetical protein BC937DRAFT_89241 [Endogone sp. FLAS-F59071]|nr:hypothetical protein BC937DRAFT_89241 [Endogone sp. FLAS-F59071]|eukprot:RUS22425.1 hypothetical protein BC937DRAFT_89241 [Endogone sp. FLAS-F59071]